MAYTCGPQSTYLFKEGWPQRGSGPCSQASLAISDQLFCLANQNGGALSAPHIHTHLWLQCQAAETQVELASLQTPLEGTVSGVDGLWGCTAPTGFLL